MSAHEKMTPNLDRTPIFKPAEPMTVLDLIGELQELVNRQPETVSWPVHILDMDDGDDVPEDKEDGKECLVTTVQTDKFSEKQGWVVSLCAERTVRDWSADK
jgi:hypothetical protein